MVGAPGSVVAMVIEKFCVALPLLFDAVTTPVNVPPVVGVPVSAPPALSVSPGGRAPEVTLNVGAGAPLAVYVCEYATLYVPLPGAPLVKAGGAPGVTPTVPDAGPCPAELVARTEHVYAVPFVRPVTVIGLPAPGALKPPGLQVAV